MTDIFSQKDRSWIMGRVRSKDTKPELKVRSMVHRLGYRFRLHKNDLPGKPDLVFKSRKKIIFVHGCFWHGHSCKRGDRKPKTNAAYWLNKISKNKERDKNTQNLLKSMGWKTLTVWECQLKDEVKTADRIIKFLD